MAAYETSAAAPLGASTVFHIVRAANNGMDMLRDWNSARMTRKALYRLSARELDDIGLCRGDIEMIGR